MQSESAPSRRSYNSAVRRQQAADTRDRILTAGTELLHVAPTWNWPALTVRAVATRAGVNERTVYRYFGSERELRDAVMDQVQQESGVDLDHLRLEDIADVSQRVFEYLASFPPGPPQTPIDPTVVESRRRKHEALVAAVTPATREWPSDDREIAAAALDLLWNVTSFRHLVYDWELEPEAAIRCVTWLIRLVERALHENQPPES
ncbi:TetR/AcrR family transcriptional regulator [Frankia nepalensis]|uniref:TetR/AcrR family transcriptional regulator n=1 Tax=Frankia nepalensis TaxID=1836974 RepID=UPI00288C5B86|nr:TetR/AcrR family transcriptional regulator [Frankia nepalensis]